MTNELKIVVFGIVAGFIMLCTGCHPAGKASSKGRSMYNTVLPTGANAVVCSAYSVKGDKVDVSCDVSTDSGAKVVLSLSMTVPSNAAANDIAGISEEQWTQIFAEALQPALSGALGSM